MVDKGRIRDSLDLDFTRDRRTSGVVMVLDGDSSRAERTAAILRAAGYHTAIEHSARDAARHMSMLGMPALVLLDEADGDFLEHMRASRHARATPVAVLDAAAPPEQILATVRDAVRLPSV